MGGLLHLPLQLGHFYPLLGQLLLQPLDGPHFLDVDGLYLMGLLFDLADLFEPHELEIEVVIAVELVFHRLILYPHPGYLVITMKFLNYLVPSLPNLLLLPALATTPPRLRLRLPPPHPLVLLLVAGEIGLWLRLGVGDAQSAGPVHGELGTLNIQLMEFIKTNEFRLPSEREVKSKITASRQQKRSEKARVTCCQFSPQLEVLTCGLSDGSIIQFASKKFNNKRLTENKEYEVRRFSNFAGTHKGEIRCILNEKIFEQTFIITGSADRTLKIWDVDPKSKDIVQTLIGHSGTVLCMTYSKKSDTIFSGSTDRTLRIWKQDESRKFFMYPWYVCYQTISEFNLKKLESPVYPTALDIHDGEISNFVLFLGDSVGNLHVIREVELLEQGRTAFEIEKSNFGYHRLNINSILYFSQEHLIVTSSFDQQIYAYESLSDKVILKYANPRKCIFTAVVWYEGMIVAADEEGTLYCIQINSDKGIEEIKKYHTRVHSLIASPGRSDLFVITDAGVDSVRIIKGIKAVEGENSHKGPIVDMFSLEAYKLTENKIKDQPKLISVSLDNSMRVWDPADLSPLEMLPSPEKSQISCLFYLRRANLFVTGHDSGAVRLWNIELQTSITISQENSTYAHTNTISAFNEYIYVRSNEDVAEFMFSAGYEGKVNVWEIFLKKSTVQSSLMSSTICPQLKFSFYPDEVQESASQIGFELFALSIWEPKGQEEEATILSAGSKGMVYFTRMFSYETYRKVKIHDDTINCMLIDENILFTSGFEGYIKLTSLDNYEQLSCLYAHEESVTHLFMLQETGHLVSKSSEGDICFWDYPTEKVVKKVRDKKEKVLSFCIVDELQMLYMGTEDAKILSCSLKDIFSAHVTKGVSGLEAHKYSELQLQQILHDNDAMLHQLLNEK